MNRMEFMLMHTMVAVGKHVGVDPTQPPGDLAEIYIKAIDKKIADAVAAAGLPASEAVFPEHGFARIFVVQDTQVLFYVTGNKEDDNNYDMHQVIRHGGEEMDLVFTFEGKDARKGAYKALAKMDQEVAQHAYDVLKEFQAKGVPSFEKHLNVQ